MGKLFFDGFEHFQAMWKSVSCWAFRLMRRWLANVFILTLQHNSTITCRVPQASFEQHLLSLWYRNILFIYYEWIENCDEFFYPVWLSKYNFLQITIHLVNWATHSLNQYGTWILQVVVKLDDGTCNNIQRLRKKTSKGL